LAAVLAGVNQMNWPRFVLFNAAGGILWAMLYGFAAFFLGRKIETFTRPVGLTLLIIGLIAVIVLLWFIRRHEGRTRA
jgi:membrane protein DedA with SNARE-associated domain